MLTLLIRNVKLFLTDKALSTATILTQLIIQFLSLCDARGTDDGGGGARVQADDGGGADVWVLKRCEACVIRRQLLQAIIVLFISIFDLSS